MSSCRICGANGLKDFEAREMMFGLREKFIYQECPSCLSIQIKHIPENLAKYYPKNYNAYHKKLTSEENRLKRFFKKKLAKDYLEDNDNWISKQMEKRFGLGHLKKLKPSNVDLSSKILDVGTGNGSRLVSLSKYGFNNLVGIEPFIDKDIHYDSGVVVYAESIFEHNGSYDLIMFNHVFEHVVQPLKVLEKAGELLSQEGSIQISIPVADSEAYHRYGKDWVALDPPRHLHVFSKQGIRNFVQKAGFEVVGELYDGSSYQFWGSEQYRKDIVLRSEESYYTSKENSIFSKDQIDNYEKEAIRLNEQAKGDTACFYLKRVSR